MISKKYIPVILFSFLFFQYSEAQQEGLTSIDKPDLRRHLEFIASDSLQGRSFGTKTDGLKIASEYIKNTAREIGLKPGAEDYFQNMKIVSFKPDKENIFITVTGKKNKTVFETGSVIKLDGTDDESEFTNEEVVLAGFGWQNDSLGYNDFSGLDVTGKIVVIAEGNPPAFLQKERSPWDNTAELAKARAIKDRLPKAVFLVTNPDDEKNGTFSQLNQWLNRPRFRFYTNTPPASVVPVFVVKPEFADALLGGKGKYRKYLTSVSKQNKPNSFPAEATRLNGKVVWKSESLNTRNVIGIVEGSDPELKNECVVFMAHYDHLGIGKDSDVYNGADDNGSGTVTLLEIADAFTHLKQKPRRSIVFLWVTCEEIGMYGSRYYTDHPLFPMNKTAACLNLDMVGRVYEPRDSVWNKSPKLVRDFNTLFTLPNNVWPGLTELSDSVCAALGIIADKSLPEKFLRSSDHYHFHKNDVPVLSISTGYHADYHKVTDEVSRIDFAKMKRVADYCFLLGYEVANLPKKRDELF